MTIVKRVRFEIESSYIDQLTWTRDAYAPCPEATPPGGSEAHTVQ